MGILIITMVTAFLVVVAIMYGTIHNLQRSNKKYTTALTVLRSRASLDLSKIDGFLTQDPIAAYRLLQDHVISVKKRKKQ